MIRQPVFSKRHQRKWLYSSETSFSYALPVHNVITILPSFTKNLPSFPYHFSALSSLFNQSCWACFIKVFKNSAYPAATGFHKSVPLGNPYQQTPIGLKFLFSIRQKFGRSNCQKIVQIGLLYQFQALKFFLPKYPKNLYRPTYFLETAHQRLCAMPPFLLTLSVCPFCEW